VTGAFVLMAGDEPTYRVIERGGWPNSKPYLTIHRLASRTDAHGVGMAVLAFAAEEAEKAGLALRADTHADNKPVQHLLKKFGFEYCGVIRVANGSERYAYQWEG
jgi:GNAT superfamily N-acetyltransferase